MNDEQIIEMYSKLIRDLKTNKLSYKSIDLNDHNPNMTIEEIISKINQAFPSENVESFIEFYTNKNKSFDDPKYERLFDLEETTKNEKIKNPSKMLDYGFRQNLVGFISKKKGYTWEDEKIDNFIASIK